MDAVTPKDDKSGIEGHSHIVRPAEMEWQKTSFPGCEAKPLLYDPKTGLATMLMKFAPGAVLPDHEHGSRHVAWTPEGGIMIAMFQIPNKFFHGDGRVTDQNGRDWKEIWGHTGKG